MTETVLKIAASVNVRLNKQDITSIKHKKNGKTTVTITERGKCNELISASFQRTIKNLQQSQTNATKTENNPSQLNEFSSATH
jgi:exonuclease III